MSPGSTRENGGRRRAQKISRNAIIVSHTQLHLFSHSLNYNPRTLITHSSLLILGTASSEVRLLYHAISRTRNSKRQNRPSFAYTRTYVAAFWEFTRVYAVYVFVYRYIMYIDSRPFSMFDPFLDIYTCVCVCVCMCVCDACVCIRVCVCISVMYFCVCMFIYVYYAYHYKYECMRVDKCVRCIQHFETNCLRVRRFFFLVHSSSRVYLAAWSRVD